MAENALLSAVNISKSYAGVYALQFSARNPAGQESTTAALVQILHVNRPPIFAPPAPRQVIAGNEIQLAVQASDPDAGDVLTFAAANLPTGATFDGATGKLVWQPSGVQGTKPVASPNASFATLSG